MIEERVIIEPPTDRSHRFAGWLLLGMISLMLGFPLFVFLISPARSVQIKIGDWPQILFFGAILIIFCGAIAILGIRMALETQKWIVARDYFEKRSEIMGWSWGKKYQATAWRLERLYHNGFYYVISPVGARIGSQFTPFYSTSSARQALKLGRQLALETGWPLRLSGELQRLEKELEL